MVPVLAIKVKYIFQITAFPGPKGHTCFFKHHLPRRDASCLCTIRQLRWTAPSPGTGAHPHNTPRLLNYSLRLERSEGGGESFMFELGWTQNGPFDAFGWHSACSIHARRSCCVCLDAWVVCRRREWFDMFDAWKKTCLLIALHLVLHCMRWARARHPLGRSGEIS